MKLVTHSETFHADDVLAYSVLSRIFPDSTLVRTRDAAEIAKGDIVFDVGGEYSPDKNRFDHHFKGSKRRPNGVAYSSFGLIWEVHGTEYLKRLYPTKPKEALEVLVKRLDAELVQGIDAVDTGFTGAETPELTKSKKIAMVLADHINAFNGTWMENKQPQDARFQQAAHFASQVLIQAPEFLGTAAGYKITPVLKK